MHGAISKKLSTKNGHFLLKNKSLETPLSWIPLCSTIFWESKTEKSRAYLLLVHKIYLDTFGKV